MQIRLIGPVEIDSSGSVVDMGPPQQRLLAAALAVDAGRLVTAESLIDRIWDDAPGGARRTLHVLVSNLRRVLAQASGREQDAVTVVRGSGGYVLRLNPAQVDMLRLRRLADDARRVDGTEEVQLLRAAVAVWQGEPLSGLPGNWAARTRTAWREEYLEVALAWARAELRTGDATATIGTLTSLAEEYPLAESATAMLMRALHAAGRPADALARYAQVRRRLADELGVDPGSELHGVYEATLAADHPDRHRITADEQLDLTILRNQPAPAESVAPPTPSPRQLPAPPQMFTGRATELAGLQETHNASTVVITAIDGMAGAGKTALAVQAAHHMVDRYPDGQLFIDLHGYTEGVAPVEPSEALDRMLRALAVAGERIPAGLDERAGLYRSRLAGQRMVIVLDNAATDAQVTPLLPGAPGCMVLVTSRRRLVGLDPTHILSLDTLPAADAVALFRRSVGDSRLAGQPPQLLAELAELCARLPLAIRIAAARLRFHPTWNLDHLVRRLRVQQDRLLELATGQRSVTAALDLSYQDLTAGLQRAYRRLGLSPAADIDAYAAAALLDTTRQEAGQALEQLLDAHLLQEAVPGRYRFHDLTRAHAAHTASRDETQESGRKTLDRLLDYYRHAAAVAMDAAYPYERERRPQVPPASTPTPEPLDPGQAVGWLDSELANLLAAASYAAEHDRPAHLHHLSTILHRHLRNRGYCHDAVTLHHQALQLARATGDQAAQIAALIGLGHIHRLQSRSEQATDHFRQALQLARASGHQAAEPDALIGLGHMHMLHGRYQQAIDHYQQALRVARGTDQSPSAQLGAQVGLGIVHRRQGRHEQATHHYRQALQLARTTGNRPGEMDALIGLGHIQRRQGRYQQAVDHYQQALQVARTTGNRNGEMQALTGLGQIRRIQGRYRQATDHYRQLLELARQSDSRNWQFEAQQGLGRIEHTGGHPEAALTHHYHALALATELNQPGDQARAHDALAHAHHGLHQLELARTHWQHALDILTRLGIDHTDDEETATSAVRAHIANLHHQTAADPPVPPG
jgi:DNA-binding SARP family transcriptional activator/Flp pilus assembly protein TadD